MTTLKPVRVLLADDSAALRRQLADRLSELSYAQVVGEADTAQSTIDGVAKKHPDVVVLDIEMPGSGIQALKTIKREYPKTRILMLTNHAGSYYKKVCLKTGADFFLDKSLEFDKVPDVLAELAET